MSDLRQRVVSGQGKSRTRFRWIHRPTARRAKARKVNCMGLKLRTVSINLPFGLGGVDIDVTEAEARAAWNLYVEMATRVAARPLEAGQGFAPEALKSLCT